MKGCKIGMEYCVRFLCYASFSYSYIMDYKKCRDRSKDLSDDNNCGQAFRSAPTLWRLTIVNRVWCLFPPGY